MKNSKLAKSIVALVAIAALAMPGMALATEGGMCSLPDEKDIEKGVEKKSYSPYVGRNFPTKPLWGDTHLHPAASLDAYAWGDKLDAEEAYRFARGEEVRSSSGERVRLSRPLDWLVIADHSEFSGIAVELSKGNPMLLVDEIARRWNKIMNEGTEQAMQATNKAI